VLDEEKELNPKQKTSWRWILGHYTRSWKV